MTEKEKITIGVELMHAVIDSRIQFELGAEDAGDASVRVDTIYELILKLNVFPENDLFTLLKAARDKADEELLRIKGGK